MSSWNRFRIRSVMLAVVFIGLFLRGAEFLRAYVAELSPPSPPPPAYPPPDPPQHPEPPWLGTNCASGGIIYINLSDLTNGLRPVRTKWVPTVPRTDTSQRLYYPPISDHPAAEPQGRASESTDPSASTTRLSQPERAHDERNHQ